MRRIILALTVAALMAVMLVLTAGPALAAGSGNINSGGEFGNEGPIESGTKIGAGTEI
jgi:hypothetical protein